MKHVVAKTIDVSEDGTLSIDGIALPWYLAPEWSLDDLSGGDNLLYGFTVTFLADRVSLTSGGEHVDTEMEKARVEAVRIVREGLKDVIEWCGYDG